MKQPSCAGATHLVEGRCILKDLNLPKIIYIADNDKVDVVDNTDPSHMDTKNQVVHYIERSNVTSTNS